MSRGRGGAGQKGYGVRVGEHISFPAAAPLPHRGIVKGSGTQATRKTIGYSYPARGGEAEVRSSLGPRSQVSTEAGCLGTKDPSHPTSRRKNSGDTPHKAPIESGGEPLVSTRALRARGAGEEWPFSPPPSSPSALPLGSPGLSP